MRFFFFNRLTFLPCPPLSLRFYLLYSGRRQGERLISGRLTSNRQDAHPILASRRHLRPQPQRPIGFDGPFASPQGDTAAASPLQATGVQHSGNSYTHNLPLYKREEKENLSLKRASLCKRCLGFRFYFPEKYSAPPFFSSQVIALTPHRGFGSIRFLILSR